MTKKKVLISYSTLFILIISTIGSSYPAVGKSKDYNLKHWPEGKSPQEIGTRIAERFLKPPHSYYRESATKIHYKTVCTWLGILWFSEASGNNELYKQFENNFAPMFDTKKHLQPSPTHVDNNVFGTVPLEFYMRTKQQKYLDLGLRYADSQWITPDDVKASRKKFAEQGYSWQTRLWVDDMFMITALQVQAFRATGERKYVDRAARQMVLYLDELQLENGLFYHHPKTPFSWGRGNGWIAAGMTELLRDLPVKHPQKKRIMSSYKKMMKALLKYQEPDGMWRQIIDDAESWKETSCTAMFSYAFIAGVKNGWLDEKTYGAAARKGWLGLISYINEDDELTEICQGTGRGDREHYMNRKRLTGDGHGTAPLLWCAAALLRQSTADIYGDARLLNQVDDGFRGIWYMNTRLDNEYKFKYSGGLGTYPANHYPFSVYVPQVNKTFFCYGGTDETNSTLLHEVSYFNHETGEVARPTIVLDKATTDAHDNPVIQVDKDGHIWLFSTAHGTGRPSFIHRSTEPYNIREFERIPATKIENGKEIPMDNFSYLQIYYHKDRGFLGLFTYYQKRELSTRTRRCRDIAWMTSPDGIHWSEWKYLSTIERGHYQTSGQHGKSVGTSFNYHPHRKERAGLNYRTNLYYLQTDDFGKTWETADGTPVDLPLTTISNDAMVQEYDSKDLNVYISDLNFDTKGNPVILYLTSKGPRSGPKHGPRQWYTASWTGKKWRINPVTVSDNNYDVGSIYIENKRNWKIIASTETGPQPYNTGGEMAMWISKNKGKTWEKAEQLTRGSKFNHAYARRPVNAHPDFYAFWADGHGREKSKSRLYFSDKEGNVFMLPEEMVKELEKPLPVHTQ